MIKKKKSKFWTFCFSFMPGAVEMYMGCMKMGTSIMGAFIASLFLTALFDCGPLLFASALIWFYGFFHARNMAAMTQEELNQVEDEYLFDFTDSKAGSLKNILINQRIIAYGLIGIGILFLWKGFFRLVYIIIPALESTRFYYLPDILGRLVIGGLIVFAGILLIKGKRTELYTQDINEEKAETDQVIALPVKGNEEEKENGTEEASENA